MGRLKGGISRELESREASECCDKCRLGRLRGGISRELENRSVRRHCGVVCALRDVVQVLLLQLLLLRLLLLL